jgi:hypothetical protein
LVVGRLDDTEWWWNVALEGIGGAVVGGLVTLIVLAAVLRHERRRSRRQFLTDECIRLVERARAMFARAFEEDAMNTVVTWDFTADLRVLSQRARPDYPRFARLVAVAADVSFVALTAAHTGKGAPDHTNPVQFAADTMQNVQDVLNGWIDKRKTYERMRKAELSRRAAAIADGTRVTK